MPLRTIKKDTAERLTLEWILHIKNYKLVLDKGRCIGCQICVLACPKDAITLMKKPKTSKGKAEPASIDVDLVKCNFCGICDASCPYGAIRLVLNGEHALQVVEKASYPELIRNIRIDTQHCQKDCSDCETACPLNLIKITRLDYHGEPVEDLESLTPIQRKNVELNVGIQKEYCPTCRVCEFKCPSGLIKVSKCIEGRIAINHEQCPKGCTDCLDVCPITNALFLSDKDRKVHVNELFCVYCGACKVVCPVDSALELERTRILHSPVRSGAWNKALEKLTSTVEMAKELKAKGSLKAKELVSKRYTFEED